jgi:hypothetical protein
MTTEDKSPHGTATSHTLKYNITAQERADSGIVPGTALFLRDTSFSLTEYWIFSSIYLVLKRFSVIIKVK